MARTLLGVAGAPVGHSRSPAMHNAALAELGLDWLYIPLPLSPERFGQTVRALPGSGFAAINVTVPHKRAAHDLAGERSPAATAIGAANTLTFADGGVRAENTDAPGFLAALDHNPRGDRALVLGAGGSARAVAWALREAGAEVRVWNRTLERAQELASSLEVGVAERPGECDLLVNCTSVGLAPAVPEAEALEALRLTGVDAPPTVADLVYGAGPTPVEAWAGRAGSRVVDGLEVLVRQGALSLEGWTGRPAPLDVMRRAARSGS